VPRWLESRAWRGFPGDGTMGDVMTADAKDLAHLRRAIALSDEAAMRGNRPFGAVLVSASGAVIAEAHNTTATDRDLTAHAEMNALRAASARCSAEEIAGATMYASGEPCPMCSGAMVRLGLRRVLYAIGDEALRPYLPAAAGLMAGSVACRDVLHLAPVPVEVLGPLLEDEARAPFDTQAARGT